MRGLFQGIHTFMHTHFFLVNKYFMRYTFFRLQRNFLCYLLSYPTYMHILRGTLPTYLIIHTYLQGILLPISTYIHICKAFLLPISTYIHICKAFCYLSQHTYIFARHFCYLSKHTGILARHFCYLSKHTCILARHFCYLSKRNMHIGKAFATYLHHLNGIFCYMFLF